MKPWTTSRLIQFCLASIALWLPVAVACACVGQHGFAWPRGAFIQHERFCRVGIASLVGAALSAAGVVYQSVLRNPLAEPYLLGVSGGASLASYLTAIATGSLAAWLEPLGQQSAAFAGALVAIAFVLLLSQRRGRLDPVTLVLVGVIVSAACGAVYVLLYHLNLRNDPTMSTGREFRFVVGAINTSLTDQQIAAAGVIIAVGGFWLLHLSGQLNIALLSESEAQALGVRIHRLRWSALIVASLITAAAVAVSGPIGFVGLVCPHLARLLVGSDVRRLFPVATALGAALLATADAASRAMSSFTSGPLPVGVLTGLLGGPFFLFLLWRGNVRRA